MSQPLVSGDENLPFLELHELEAQLFLENFETCRVILILFAEDVTLPPFVPVKHPL